MESAIMESRYFKVREIAPGVYAALPAPGRGAFGNAGFVDLGEGVLVFDTMFTPAAGRELRRVAEGITGKPVRWVVNSHRDYDHFLGNQAFADVDRIATRTTREVMERRTPQFLEQVRTGHAAFLAELRDRIAREEDPRLLEDLEAEYGEFAALAAACDELLPCYPSIVFDGALTIRGAARRAELLCFGAMHTESDLVLLLPEERILLAGDVVMVGHHPPLRCGGPDEWAAFVDRLLALDVERVLPGHGELGSMQDIELMGRYVRRIRDWAVGGSPVEEPFRSWRFADALSANLEYARGLPA